MRKENCALFIKLMASELVAPLGGGGGGGFPNDYASVILIQWLCVKLITEGGECKCSKN